MRKKNIMIIFIISMIAMLTACACEHEWEEATCQVPKTCKVCGDTEGDILEHNWTLATCEEAAKCNECGIESGVALGHDWDEATCTEPAICTQCGLINGEALGHNWIEATCVVPKTCSVCETTDGEPLEHEEGEGYIVKEASETEVGIKQIRCKYCDEILEEEYLLYYDITKEEEVLYKNVLDTLYSIKECLINPETLEFLGATKFSDDRRTTIHVQWDGTDGNTYTYYFWKDVGKKTISNVFGQTNYEGNPNSHTVEQLDLAELTYYANSGIYEKTIISSEHIVFE